MQIETLDITDLTPDPKNARQHDAKNLKAIEGSLSQFGQRKPIVITEANVIVAGNGTVTAAKNLGWATIDAVRVPADWSEDQVKAFALADNRTAELATWSPEVLAAQLIELESAGFEIAEFGFDKVEPPIDPDLLDEDELPEPPSEPITKLGDLWQLGRHRLLCGDSTDMATVKKLMDSQEADIVFTDPPFGNDLGYGRGQLGERYILNDSNTDVLEKMFEPINAVLKNNSHCLVWIQWRTFSVLEKAMSKYKLRTVVIWDKKQAGLSGGGFAEQYEMLCVFIKGHATQNFYSGNVWSISREHGPRTEMEHPHKKPIEVLAKALDIASKPSDLVLDVFGGSGSTLIACEKTQRTCYMMELDPKYCDVIIKRWETLTGLKAELVNATR
jgi:DNA modification methylase